MHYLIRHDVRHITHSGYPHFVSTLLTRLIAALRVRHPGHEFEVGVDPTRQSLGFSGTYSCLHLSIVNPSNGRYILVSLLDHWRHHFQRSLGWQADHMVQFFFPAGFDFADYFAFKREGATNPDLAFPDRIEDVYRGIAYPPYVYGAEAELERLFLAPRRPSPRLLFRGWVWPCRVPMVDGLDCEDIVIVDTNTGGERLEYLDYLTDLGEYTAALSLPGGAPICHRDIEAFAIGVPVIRPYLPCHHPDPLVPGVHYICCYHQPDYSSGDARFVSSKNFQANLIKTWNTVKNDPDFLAFVAQNARAWYARNCTMDVLVDRLAREINLESLG
jgi:hypothetical protein